MMKKENKNEDFLSNCAACAKALRRDDVSVIEEGAEKTIFHVSCSHCQALSLIFLSENEKGSMSVGFATDLRREEAKAKLSNEPIGADEIIDLYEKMFQRKEKSKSLQK